MQKSILFSRRSLTFIAVALVAQTASAIPIIYTDRAAWEAAVMAASGVIAGEDFSGLSDTWGRPGGDGMNGLLEGPHTFPDGGGFSITLNDLPDGSPDPDFGGSMSGIVSEAFHFSLVADTTVNDDFELFPGFFVEGEGIVSATLGFADPGNFAFGADFFNASATNPEGSLSADGFIIDVNSVLVNAATLAGFSGVGFIGIIDTDGISSLNLITDDLSMSQMFQELTIDDVAFAVANGPVVPEPATMTLMGLGLAGFALRRRKMKA